MLTPTGSGIDVRRRDHDAADRRQKPTWASGLSTTSGHARRLAREWTACRSVWASKVARIASVPMTVMGVALWTGSRAVASPVGIKAVAFSAVMLDVSVLPARSAAGQGRSATFFFSLSGGVSACLCDAVGQFGELNADLRLYMFQFQGETLHAWVVHFRRVRQAAEKSQGLEEVVVYGLARQRRNRLRHKFRGGRLDAEKTVHAAGELSSGRSLKRSRF